MQHAPNSKHDHQDEEEECPPDILPQTFDLGDNGCDGTYRERHREQKPAPDLLSESPVAKRHPIPNAHPHEDDCEDDESDANVVE